VATNLVDPLSRVEGVGSVQVFGAKYAMRIWLDPAKLDTYPLTTGDVIAAIQAQNAQVSAGQLGGTPALPGQQLNATITAQSRLQTPEQFRAIVLRSSSDGSLCASGDVPASKSAPRTTAPIARYNGQPAAGIGVKLAPAPMR
jgi:multidrug efflux pump subunit AcrB